MPDRELRLQLGHSPRIGFFKAFFSYFSLFKMSTKIDTVLHIFMSHQQIHQISFEQEVRISSVLLTVPRLQLYFRVKFKVVCPTEVRKNVENLRGRDMKRIYSGFGPDCWPLAGPALAPPSTN